MANERPETRLKCALVVRGAFDAHVVPAFEAAGGRTTIHWAPTTVIMKTLSEGETADAVLVLSDAIGDPHKISQPGGCLSDAIGYGARIVGLSDAVTSVG